MSIRKQQVRTRGSSVLLLLWFYSTCSISLSLVDKCLFLISLHIVSNRCVSLYYSWKYVLIELCGIKLERTVHLKQHLKMGLGESLTSLDQLGHGPVLQCAHHCRISHQGPWGDETFSSMRYWTCSVPWKRRMNNSSINRDARDTSKVPLIGYLTADTDGWGTVGKLTRRCWWCPSRCGRVHLRRRAHRRCPISFWS